MLLQLNHNIVEPFLTDMLGIGWLVDKTGVPGETLAALDKFLDELVITYSKLRQVPKLVNKLLDCLCGCHGNKTPIAMTPRFFKRSVYLEELHVLTMSFQLGCFIFEIFNLYAR